MQSKHPFKLLDSVVKERAREKQGFRLAEFEECTTKSLEQGSHFFKSLPILPYLSNPLEAMPLTSRADDTTMIFSVEVKKDTHFCLFRPRYITGTPYWPATALLQENGFYALYSGTQGLA